MRDTIVRGVCEGILAYVGKTAKGDYDPFLFRKNVTLDDVELSEDVYIVTKETAEAYLSREGEAARRYARAGHTHHADQAGADDTP